MSSTRVVVTGLGTTSPLGGDVPTTWSALLEGVSGVTAVRVELEPGADSAVFVDSEGPLDIPAAKAAVVEAGYSVVG